jgi:hypothetical protein
MQCAIREANSPRDCQVASATSGSIRLAVTKSAIPCFGKSSVFSDDGFEEGESFELRTSLTEVMEYQRKWPVRKLLILRAGDRDRTGDVQLGKSVFD